MKFFINFMLALLICHAAFSQENKQLTILHPDAVVDLRTTKGAGLVQAKWYVQNARIVNQKFKAPGDTIGDALPIYPTGATVQTNNIKPNIRDKDFDKGFKSIAPTSLEDRQGTGLVSFVWYKAVATLPEKIGTTEVKGTKAVLEIMMDDYSEIWVNGKQTRNFGQVGNGVISGYNAVNRIVLSEDAKPGETFNIAILGINGEFGNIPPNYIWVRNATIDFYKQKSVNPRADWQDIAKIYTIDEKLNQIIGQGQKVQKVADGFSFTEGPVWHPNGYLLFSDPNMNTIYRYDPKSGDVSILMSHSGYTGEDIGEYHQPGSNGLTIDKEGRLIIDQHGNRRVVRIEKKGHVTVLADTINGKRLNSPNDIVLKSDGTIYFTDPPYGLPNNYSDKRKELGYQGVFMIKNGKVQVVAKDCGGPNGIAFSPDEKYLYVDNWDIRDVHHTKTIWRYEVQPDGTLANGKIFFDCNQTEDEEAMDGMKVDKAGNIFVSAPGGVWIISDKAELLGKIVFPERPANMAWGDEDGKTLYFTARTGICKLRILTGGKFSWQ
jgi:gluconolactonase